MWSASDLVADADVDAMMATYFWKRMDFISTLLIFFSIDALTANEATVFMGNIQFFFSTAMPFIQILLNNDFVTNIY